MKGLGRLVLSLLAVVTGLLVTVTPAQAVVTCHQITAKAEGRITGPTPTGFTTESSISGGGLVHGTTTADLSLTSFDPETGLATFEGSLVLTTQHGTLTLFVLDGMYDTVTGEFSSGSAVTGGTDRFDGATGGLFFHGFVLSDGVSFIDDEISGEICVDLP